MKTVITQFCLLAIFILATYQTSFANHAWGGDISFTHISNNSYSIQLRLYRDCNGIILANTQDVQLNSTTCGSLMQTLNLLPNYPRDISPVCDATLSRCNNLGGVFGIEEYIYKATINLPNCFDNIDDITISWSECCVSNYATTVIGSSPIYLWTKLNTTVDNSSPEFLNDLTSQFCHNQLNSFSHGFYENDGDSLVFSLVDCRADSSTILTYSSGYSGIVPLSTTNGVSINSQTGNVEFTPNLVQTGVICILVEEYRNGVKISEMVKENLMFVSACTTNDLPELSGIDGTIDANSSTGSFEASFCYSDTISFKLSSFDNNIINDTSQGAQSLSMEMNLAGAITGATFTMDNSSTYPKGFFDWIPTVNDIGTYTFDITVKDDNCPINGTNTYTYTIHIVGEQVDVSSLNFGTFCLDTASFVLTNYTPITGGYWSGSGIVDSILGLFNTSQAGVGVHVLDYQLLDVFGCSYQENVTVFVINNYAVDAGIADTICSEATPFWLTGQVPINGIWGGAGVTTDGLFSPLQAGVGTHSLIYTNSLNNCIASDQKLITVLQTPDVDAGGVYSACINGTTQLTGMPLGGIWIGQGIDTTGFFDASLIMSSLTSTNVIYQYSNGSCDNLDFAQINIIPPTAVDAGATDTVKATDAVFSLSGQSPLGGTWSGTGIIDGQNGIFDPNIGHGTYTLTYAFEDTICGTITDTKMIFVDFGVSTDEVLTSTDISIYPNPFSDYVIIHFKNALPKNARVIVLDALGSVVKEVKIDKNDYSLSLENTLPVGVYFIKIKEENSERVFKIMKE